MLKEIIISIQAYFEAHLFISKHKLWKWILIPGFIYSILFVVGIYLFWISSNDAIEFILLKSGVKGWLDRMHDSWLNFFFIVGQIILRLVLLLFYFSLFKFLFLIIASPVFAYLSEKTESIIQEKEFPFSLNQLLKDIMSAQQSIDFIGNHKGLAIGNGMVFYLLHLLPVLGWLLAPSYAVVAATLSLHHAQQKHVIIR